jgi:hypothetical protein
VSSNDFITQKVVFLAVNASLRWLNNVGGVCRYFALSSI